MKKKLPSIKNAPPQNEEEQKMESLCKALKLINRDRLQNAQDAIFLIEDVLLNMAIDKYPEFETKEEAEQWLRASHICKKTIFPIPHSPFPILKKRQILGSLQN